MMPLPDIYQAAQAAADLAHAECSAASRALTSARRAMNRSPSALRIGIFAKAETAHTDAARRAIRAQDDLDRAYRQMQRAERRPSARATTADTQTSLAL
ncbi:MAG TPA: hypothetical protein VMV33_17370 [Rhodocyclaceae bacterium]|nr:hypothetical protein [Rhodocyclaceae bacterium]